MTRHLNLLCAEDDEDDRLLLADALVESGLPGALTFVEDGQQLTDRLNSSGSPGGSAYPDLILLDLNMPAKDGREALAEIKRDPRLRHIPVVVLTTSNAPADVTRSYSLGVNSYVVKPQSFRELVRVIQSIILYWGDVTSLPETPRDG